MRLLCDLDRGIGEAIIDVQMDRLHSISHRVCKAFPIGRQREFIPVLGEPHTRSAIERN